MKDFNKFKKLQILRTETEKIKKTNVHDTASKLYDELLETYYDQSNCLSYKHKENRKYKPKKFMDEYDYSVGAKK